MRRPETAAWIACARDSARRLAARCALPALLLLAAGCACPSPPTRYDTPVDTLRTWQARLCADDPQGEYACLAASMKRRLQQGFENYYAAREALLRDHPAAAWLFSRSDLDARIVATSFSADGLHASVTLDARDELLDVVFEREAWVRLVRDDGSQQLARQERAMGQLVTARNGSQWLLVEKPPLTDPDRLREIHVESRWLISDLAGLAGTDNTLPPGDPLP